MHPHKVETDSPWDFVDILIAVRTFAFGTGNHTHDLVLRLSILMPAVAGSTLADDFDEAGFVITILPHPLQHFWVHFRRIASSAIVSDGLQVRLPHSLPFIDIARVLLVVRHGDRVLSQSQNTPLATNH